MGQPTFHIEAAFGSRPGDSSYAWTDISERVRSFSYDRGRNYELDRIDAGQGKAVLRDEDRALDPNYGSSPYYPNVVPLVPIRAYAVLDATTYYQFQHYVETWERRRYGQNYAEREIETVDGFEILGLRIIQPTKATMTTALGGNRDITYTAVKPGTDGNKITIRYQAGKPTGVAKVQVHKNDISVLIPTAGVTASSIVSAINATKASKKLVVAALATGSSGAGTVTTMATTALSGGRSTNFAQELSGTRVTNVLDLTGWPSALRLLSVGKFQVQARTFQPADSVPALQHLQDVIGEGGEDGWGFIDGRGRFVFLDATTLVTTPYTVSQATFSDEPAVGEIEYQDVVTSESNDLIFNEFTGTRQGGVAQTVVDLDSQAKYLRRVHQMQSVLTSDAKLREKMSARLSDYKDPYDRLRSFTVMPGETSAAWAACLAREPGDRITVNQHPPGAGGVDTRDYIVQHISPEIDLAALSKSKFTFQVWPATTRNWLIVDSATFGTLDVNKVAA